MQGLQPQVEKMEAAWARLHTITGAETPEEVLAYFEGTQFRWHPLPRHPAGIIACQHAPPHACAPHSPQAPQLTSRMS